ncbi:MAG: MarC family protein [Candidatus Woesearchaeota archaeon]
MEYFLYNLAKCFFALFVIIDPFLGLAMFISLTKKLSARERAEQASIAVFVAFGLLVVFLLLGVLVLELLGISFASFVVAGGIILLVLGIQVVLGIEFHKKRQRKAAAVLIGTPLLCGPGAMTTIIILGDQYGYLVPVVAAAIALAMTWFMLYNAKRIQAFFGERLVEVLSRVLGLVIAALAIEFIKDGVIAMVGSV